MVEGGGISKQVTAGKQLDVTHDAATVTRFTDAQAGHGSKLLKQSSLGRHRLETIEEVTDHTKAGGGCGDCHHEIADLLREFQDKLFHFHAKDVKIRRDRLNEAGIFAYPLEWHQPRIPGFGDIDWARFMAALMEVGYDGPVCIEVEDDTFGKSLEGRQRALKVARNVLESYFA